MKKLVIVAIVLSLTACKVQKVGQDTYKVVTPPQTKDAEAKAKAGAKKAGAELKDAAQKIGAKVERATDTHRHQ